MTEASEGRMSLRCDRYVQIRAPTGAPPDACTRKPHTWKTVWVQYLIRVGTKDVKRRGGHNARRTPPPPSFPAAIHQPGNG